jgi:hypothetical protein
MQGKKGTGSRIPDPQHCSAPCRRAQTGEYQQYVKSHLEFGSPAWSPWQEGDKECLEKRAMGMVAGLKSRDHMERLEELGLTTLEERQHQLDMVQVLKKCEGSGRGVNSE